MLSIKFINQWPGQFLIANAVLRGRHGGRQQTLINIRAHVCGSRVLILQMTMASISDDWHKEFESAVQTTVDVLKSQAELLKQRIEEQRKKDDAEKDKPERRGQLQLQEELQQDADTNVERQKLEDEKKAMEGVSKFQSTQVKLNVGGQRFATSRSTLKHPDSILASSRHEGAFFILIRQFPEG